MPIVDGAQPWSHDGGPVAVVLVHGFNGSPRLLRPWGEALAARGLTVRIPRLPGHGTTWREANLTRWPDWYAEVDRTFSAVRAGHPRVVVAGFAMGGALALRLAALRGSEVTGLILVNPSVLSEEPRASAVAELGRIVPAWPAAAADVRRVPAPEGLPTRVPTRALSSLPELWADVRPRVPGVVVPTLLMSSAQDHVVPPENSDWVASHIGSNDVTHVVLRDSYHLAPIDGDRDLLATTSARFVERITGQD